MLACYFRRAHFLLLGDPNQAIFEGTATWDEMRAVFEEMRGAVSQCRLMTSYRSTPAITDLFAQLLPAGEAMEVASVQREAPAPEIVVCEIADEWKAALVESVREAREAGGLTAVIVPWKTTPNASPKRWSSRRHCAEGVNPRRVTVAPRPG